MPKKTKKEKLLALYRKKIRLLENKQSTTVPASPIVQSPESKLIENREIKNKTISVPPEKKVINQYFFSDLKKSLLLIVLILGLEVSLYFARLVR